MAAFQQHENLLPSLKKVSIISKIATSSLILPWTTKLRGEPHSLPSVLGPVSHPLHGQLPEEKHENGWEEGKMACFSAIRNMFSFFFLLFLSCGLQDNIQ